MWYNAVLVQHRVIMNINEIFINRKKELAEMTFGVKSGQKYVLIAPRRYGKTTLLRKLAEQIALDPKMQTIYIDIMKYSDSVMGLAEAITEALLAQAGVVAKIRNWISNLDTRLDLKIKVQELEIDAIIEGIQNKDAYKSLDAALQYIEKLALKQDKHFVVIFDEIGELENLDAHAIKIMRSVIQHHKNVSYLFAGSKETVMKQIFISKAGAFYRFGIIYQLGELEINDVIEFFKDNIQYIDENVIDYIVDKFYGHPYYTTNIFYRMSQKLELNMHATITMVTLQEIMQELITAEKHYLDEQIKRIRLKKNHFTVFKTLIEKNFDKHTFEFSQQYLHEIIQDLELWGYIRHTDGQYKLTDPLMSLYLADDSLSLI